MKYLLSLLVLSFFVLAVVGCDDGEPADGGVDDAGPGDAGVDVDGGGEACGDGALATTEACDDGNSDDDDGCSASCEVESGWDCSGEPSSCTSTCGDGVVVAGEGCDDGNTDAADGCDASCAVEDGYTCTGEPSACATVCGDGAVAGDEACDDGNTDALDGCDDACEVETGVTCTGEPSVCTAVCGDGVIATIEECDTGATGTDDGCDDTCAVERGFSCMGEPSVCMTGCGDGIVAGTETCDDGNLSDGDGCAMACRTERGYVCTGEPSTCDTNCGDGIVVMGVEACDDGNTMTMDGCSDTCAEETGFTCAGEPSVCDTTCGDGIVAGMESCDDGDGLLQGDGCDLTCNAELGYTCTGTPSVCTLTETVAEVALGGFGGCVRTTSGVVGCFGDNTESEVGNNTDDVETFLPADTGIADATLVVAGDEHHCALRAGGTVWCWGDNNNSQQGLAGGMDQPVPQQLAGVMNIAFLAAGDDHNCGVDMGGTVACWGDNDNRQLGRGGTSTTDDPTPMAVTMPGGLSATSIDLGENHSCALLSDGTVACWGDDDNGQLGDGTSGTDSGVATVVPGVSNVAQVSAGGDNTCVRTMAGAVSCWGDNIDGQLGNGTSADSPTPGAVTLPAPAVDISVADDFACALLNDDRVFCWGESEGFQTGVGSLIDQDVPAPVLGLGGLSLSDVEAGTRGVCVLTTTGRRYCWGYGEEGQLGSAPLNQLALTAPLSFASGAPTSLALSGPEYRGQVCATFASGAVECAGTGDGASAATTTGAVGVFPGFPQHLDSLTVIPSLMGTLQGALGDGFACGRTAAGVACVGDNAQRQLGQGTSTTDSDVPVFVAGVGAADEIAVGAQFACARTVGAVQCWGDNDNFQAGDGSTTTDQGAPVSLTGVTDATQLALGENHGCLLRSGGGVACWGDNGVGQLGTGTSGTDSGVPLAVTLPAAATKVVSGQDHSCALVGADVYCWGENGRGQLAQGTTTDSAAPVLALSGATDISAGYNFTCAIRSTGGVSCWGYGLDGHLGNGGAEVTGADDFLSPVDWPGVSGVTGIATGNSVTCLQTAAGWRCAGFRGEGHLGNGTSMSPAGALPVFGL